MKPPSAALTLSRADARRACILAQGLGDSRASSPSAAVEATGFVRTLGGADVYVAVRARLPELTRADLDRAVERSELQVVPAVRGCIYLVPRRHVALALTIAARLTLPRVEREHAKAGIESGEIEQVASAVVETLSALGPTKTDALRRALPEGVVRSLGESGKKLGISSTLPPALRMLEFQGCIERTLEGGRLDSERYLWRVPRSNPLAGARFGERPHELAAELAPIFFGAAGLATPKEFAAWTGLTLRDAQAGMAQADLLPVAVEGQPERYFAAAWVADRIDSLGRATEATALLPFEDNLTALHCGPQLLIDSEHYALEVPVWGSRSARTPLGTARHMSLRSVVADGRIAGFWEFDPESGEVVLGWLETPREASRRALEPRAHSLAAFLTKDIGHGRSFSLDTDEDLRERAELVRKIGAQASPARPSEGRAADGKRAPRPKAKRAAKK